MPQRSRRGCWTCKRRHKKCDETQPVCHRCTKAGLACAGYEVRLTWGSRANDSPLVTRSSRARAAISNPPRSEDPRSMTECDSAPAFDLDFAVLASDELDSLLLQYGSGNTSSTDDALLDDETAQQLMDDFAADGHKNLTGRWDEPSLLKTDILPMCSSSLPLRYVCIAYQASLRAVTAHRTPVYMQSALSHFLRNLGEPDELQLDSTLATGILLCSVSINCLYVWTPLLTGLYGMLEHRGLLAEGAIANASPLARHLLEVIALMDIECFNINRRSQPLGLWKNVLSYRDPVPSGIEQTSGLPYSLVNIMADLHAVDAEHRLLHWPYAESDNLVEYHLWEAFRSAGILHSRALTASATLETDGSITSPQSVFIPCGPPPSAKALRMRALACIQAIVDSGACVFRDSLARGLLYPLFIAGAVAERPEERRVIRVAFQYLGDPAQVNMESAVARLVFRVWEKADPDADHTARVLLATELAAEDNVEIHLS